MPIFLNDTFTDTNGTALTAHTPNTGGTWTNGSTGSGNFTITGNRVYFTTSDRFIYNTASPANANYVIDATFDKVADQDSLAIMGRISTTQQDGYVLRYDANGNTVDLFCFQNGSVVGGVLLTASVDASGNSSIRLRLSMNGTTIGAQYALDGGALTNVGAGSVVNSTISAAGKAGFYADAAQSSTTGWHCTSMFAQDIPARTAVAPNNANIRYSPENWGTISASNARCNIQGGYTILKVTVADNSDVDVVFDTSRLNGLSAGSAPTVACEMDGLLLDLNGDGLYRKALPTNANSLTLTLKTAPADGDHVFVLYVRSMAAISGTTPGPWGASGNPPPGCVDIDEFGIGSTSSMAALTSGTDYYPDTALAIGDSVTVGILAGMASGSTGDSTSATAANNDTRVAWPMVLRHRFKVEVGFVAQGGLGYQTQSGTFQGSSTANPPLDTANGAGETFWSHHWNGNARTHLTTHKYIFVQCGPNDGGSLTTTHIEDFWDQLRTDCGATPVIFQVVEPGQRTRATQIAAAPPDADVHVLDWEKALYSLSVPSTYSPDFSHMNREGHAVWGAVVAGLADEAMGGGGGVLRHPGMCGGVNG